MPQQPANHAAEPGSKIARPQKCNSSAFDAATIEIPAELSDSASDVDSEFLSIDDRTLGELYPDEYESDDDPESYYAEEVRKNGEFYNR